MTQEQIERTIEFILNQQASTSVKLDMMVEQQAEANKRLEQVNQRLEKLEKTTHNAIKLGSRFIAGLGKANKESREIQKKHEENLTRIEENLNAVIILFERHITETHGTI